MSDALGGVRLAGLHFLGNGVVELRLRLDREALRRFRELFCLLDAGEPRRHIAPKRQKSKGKSQ